MSFATRYGNGGFLSEVGAITAAIQSIRNSLEQQQ